MNNPATTPITAAEADTPVPLRLRDIASWQLPKLAQRNDQGEPIKPRILPGLPSLQRGSVWKPNQIELLWDSVLRGFPIGSMVVCRRLDNQATRTGVVAGPDDPLPWPVAEYDHHLLDGQQRANALALGYLDPFPADLPRLDPDTLLWLDLDPDRQGSSHFPSASSRSFLLRVTTVAHPWGFKVSDNKEPTRLEHHKAKEARDAFRAIHQGIDSSKRPRPRDGWPFEANVPIPMAWALEAAHEVFPDTGRPPASAQPECDLWRWVLDRCTKFLADHPNPQPQSGAPTNNDPRRWWASRAKDLLDQWCKASPANPPPEALHLAQALARAVRAQTVALPVPDDALTQPRRTAVQPNATNVTADQQDISNVEHLFQRLNGGGTMLDGDELRYSMIKAYWPGIERTIQAIKPRPPDTQVALLGARLALDSGDGTFPAAPTVETLRGLATVTQIAPVQGASESKHVAERRAARERIEVEFGLQPAATTNAPQPNQGRAPLAQAFERFDAWFLHDNSTKPWGLPKVLRSRLADQAPDVFLFLLWLAKAHGAGVLLDETIRRRLLGLATALHWFGTKDRTEAVRWLWKIAPMDWLDGTAFRSEPHLLATLSALPSKDSSTPVRTVAGILTPEALENYIDVNTFAQDKIEHWRWWQTLIVAPAEAALGTGASDKMIEKESNNRWRDYQDFIPVLNRSDYQGTNALLLIYAQREQMAHLFREYDPSQVGYWDLHNRPWDFDHILPQSAFTNLKQSKNTYMESCKQWGKTIANLHILPFEENRSRHAKEADKSLRADGDSLRRMLLLDAAAAPSDRRPFFSLTSVHVKDSDTNASLSRQKVHDFIIDARSRLLRIYRDWFDTLLIRDLL